MFKMRKIISAVICAALLVSSVPFAVSAEEFQIDVSDLWKAMGDENPNIDNRLPTVTPGTDENKDKEDEEEKEEPEIPDTPVNPDTSPDIGDDVPPEPNKNKDKDKKTVTTGGGTPSDNTPTGNTPTDNTPTDIVTPPEPETPKSFTDVKEEDWFYKDVMDLAAIGVINGYEDGSFMPEGQVTRAEFLKMLVSLTVAPGAYLSGDLFEDVKMGDWYDKYVVTAWYNGYIDEKDYGEKFLPDKPITRREVAKIIVAACVDGSMSGYVSPYEDTADPNAIALYSLCLMCGSIDPYNGRRFFYPDTFITRAEVSAVINRINVILNTSPEEFVNNFKAQYNIPDLQKIG